MTKRDEIIAAKRAPLNLGEAAGAGILMIAVCGLGLAWAGYAFGDLDQTIVAVFAIACDLIWQLVRRR